MESARLIFRTSEVAELAGVELRRVQRLLETENVYLDGIALRPGEKAHRRFSEIDVIRVALICRLNDHGVVPAKVASGLVEEIVDPYRFASGNADGVPVEKKIEIILLTLCHTQVHGWFDEQQDKWVCASYCDRPDGSREVFGTSEAARQLADKSRDVYIVVNLARITRGYFQQLEKILDEEGVSK